jgi:predicted DNA-binding transcriptional regulator YafY
MPINYQALVRFRVINRLLIEERYVTMDQMKSACERTLHIFPLGERTIEGDIHMMRKDTLLGYNAPIGYNRAEKTYYYTDPDYSIDNIPLNDDEINSIIFAARLLEQFQHIGIFSQFTDSVRKIAQAVDVYREFDEDEYSNAIEFEKAVETLGTDYIGPLIEAITEKYAVRLTYRSFTSEKNTENIIHPYLLKEYRNRWYLIGYNEKYKSIRTYCLDRFVNLEKEERIAFLQPDFNAKEYYKNVMGISVLNEKPLDIEIAFSDLQAQYIITQPLHSSQRRYGTIKGRKVFGFRLVPNFEFMSYIMGLGKEAVILKPVNLRSKMKKALGEAIVNYE